MNKSKKMDSCSELFKAKEILSFYSQYIWYFLSYCMWWTTNTYLQRTEKSINTTLDLLIIFIYLLLI